MEKKLGLGCMRLPLTEPGNPAAIDGKEVARMVAAALERGFTYFDTAWTYHDGASEEALRRTLVERYPREAYRLTDKLPTMRGEHAEQQERIFDEQLRRCGVEWFDGYLVHCATAAFCERAERLGSFDFALRKREEGRIRRVGFSYHDSPELLDELLTRHPEVDFVQLQISYVDWEGTPIRSRRCHEIARRHGKPIVVMCPLNARLGAAARRADVPRAASRSLARVVGPAFRRKPRRRGDRAQRHVVDGRAAAQCGFHGALRTLRPCGVRPRGACGRPGAGGAARAVHAVRLLRAGVP